MSMIFNIRKNASLPVLKMQVVKDGTNDISDFMSLIESSDIFFSMKNMEDGSYKIINSNGGFVEKTFLDPNAKTEYYVYYRFSENETNLPGTYEGEFIFKNDNGTQILPIREKLIINIKESSIV
jgi:hypothetical protein